MLLVALGGCTEFGTAAAPVDDAAPADAGDEAALADASDAGGGDAGDARSTSCVAGESSTVLLPRLPEATSSSGTFSVVGAKARFEAVDDVGAPDEDATFVRCADDGGNPEWVSLSTTPPALPPGSQIRRVAIFARARMEIAGRTASVAPRMSLGGKHHGGGGQALSATYADYRNVFDSDPTTDTPWTDVAVGLFTLRIECSASDPDNGIRITQVWAEICHVPP